MLNLITLNGTASFIYESVIKKEEKKRPRRPDLFIYLINNLLVA